MRPVIIFAGTTEGRKLSEYLAVRKVPVTACVATEYGETLLTETEYLKVHAGRMDEAAMGQFFEEQTRGYIYEDVKSNGTIVREMPDGTRYSYRNFSHSDNTPVVEIWGVWPARQKIHFIGKE